MQKINLTNLKEKIQKIDFLLITLIGLYLCFLVYEDLPNSEKKVYSFVLLFLIPFVSLSLSIARYNFVYGTDDYKKNIAERRKKFSLMTPAPSKKLVLGIIWFGSFTPMIISVSLENYFSFFIFFMLAAFLSFVMTISIDKRIKNDSKNQAKANKIKFSYDYLTIFIIPILGLFFAIGSFIFLKEEIYVGFISFLSTSVLCFLTLSLSLRK